MKTKCFRSCLVALMAPAFFALSCGAAAAASGTTAAPPAKALPAKPIYQPVPATQPVFKGDYISLADADAKPQLAQPAAALVYPVELKKHSVAGEAVVAFIVTADGKTDQVQVVRATHRGFADAVVACVKKWHYTPASKDGKPVNCLMQLPIAFDLDQ